MATNLYGKSCTPNLGGIQDFYTKAEVNQLLNAKANISTVILSGAIVDSDISSAAEIAVSKLGNGTANQIIQTAANGTTVEWTSNLRIPGSFSISTKKTPLSATDAGNIGEICWDENYIYVCTSANTWKRSALNSW